MAVHDAFTTASTLAGNDKKKTGDGGTVSRSGAAIPKPGQTTQKGTYGGRRVKLYPRLSRYASRFPVRENSLRYKSMAKLSLQYLSSKHTCP